MATIEEVELKVTELSNTIASTDSKLDEIKAFIATLKVGVVTQEQLDSLAAKIDGAKSQASAVLQEADDLDQA